MEADRAGTAKVNEEKQEKKDKKTKMSQASNASVSQAYVDQRGKKRRKGVFDGA